MTNDQRKKLVVACQEQLTGSPRDPTVEIILNGVEVSIDYCLKHGTGTGAIKAIVLTDNAKSLDFPTIEMVDQRLIDWAKQYLDVISAMRDYLAETLDEIDDRRTTT